jgi:hypothetical protein
MVSLFLPLGINGCHDLAHERASTEATSNVRRETFNGLVTLPTPRLIVNFNLPGASADHGDVM